MHLPLRWGRGKEAALIIFMYESFLILTSWGSKVLGEGGGLCVTVDISEHLVT